MDIMNRGVRSNQSVGHQAENATGGSHHSASNKTSKLRRGKLTPGKIGSTLFLLAIVILGAAALSSLIFSKNANEARFIDHKKFQAVFLNGGQVYFGKISDLNRQHLKISNIYYLRVNQQVQPDANAAANPNDISLVKLGCELHGPEDDMVINREQIIFWENLKDDGQVTKAIAEYVKKNPDGQKCETENTTPASGTNTNSTPAATTPAPTTNTNNTRR